jgi:hypothetical protein
MFEFATFLRLYWDFMSTFPLLALMAYFTTRPLLNNQNANSDWYKLGVYTFLLVWPLVGSYFALTTCASTGETVAALFVGCLKRTPGAMRFSAVSYMFFFNLGSIVASMVQSPKGRFSASWKTTAFFVALLIPCIYHLFFVLQLNKSWEYLDFQGYRRFPLSAPLALAWAALSFSALTIAGLLVATQTVWTGWLVRGIEHLGANVLLYLVVNNLFILANYRGSWLGAKGNNTPRSPGYSNFTWELITVAFALLSIALTKLIIFLATKGRK